MPFFPRVFTTAILLFAGAAASAQMCPPRPVPGSVVADPYLVASQSGALNLALTIHNYDDFAGDHFYCYNYQGVAEAPTLQVDPGDAVSLTLKNNIQGLSTAPMMHSHENASSADPCHGVMTDSSTNIHYHGLNLPPICHQDEAIFTLINPTDAPFHYNFKIPANEPPGLYWYHPHPHGITLTQLSGGANGAIVVTGIEKVKPQVAGLTQRIMIFRDQPASGGDPDAGGLTLNFVPIEKPIGPNPTIQMGPSEKQFWRVLNATAGRPLRLKVNINNVAQPLELIELDSVPVAGDPTVTEITIPPAGRAEFIVQGPPDGASGELDAGMVFTGKDGDPDVAQSLATIVATSNASTRGTAIPQASPQTTPVRFADLATQPANTIRQLYFSEDLSDPDHPKFYVTVKGQKPMLFDPNEPPAIVTKQGAVEDWIIQNRSQEIHAFHIHQIHFMLLAKNGVALDTPTVQDTVLVDPWDGKSSTYPSVKVRMDFRYPESVGTFLYHCHLVDHEDGGMMAKIEVDPAN
ncbi:MAG: multicopper oxidase domain-containing protein [Acidobacteriales bacterium]|nr:multicopper oxidase domain-containing protein [Terriglobales bacterium]